MKERPILFSGPMVRAIVEDRKTQTRRAIKPQPELNKNTGMNWRGGAYGMLVTGEPYLTSFLKHCPYGEIGDRLWVRETFTTSAKGWIYKADGHDLSRALSARWKPSIHMPRRVCRIVLEITKIRIEPLQKITEDDAKAEGANFVAPDGIHHSGWRHDYRDVFKTAKASFAHLWESINGPKSWEENPLVWVIEFKRVMPVALTSELLKKN